MSEDTILTINFKKNHVDSDETVKLVTATMLKHYNIKVSYQQQNNSATWSLTGTIANLRKADIIK